MSRPEDPLRLLADRGVSPSPDLLRSALDAADVLLYVKDRQGRYLFVNRALAEALGRPPAEVLGHDVTHCFPPEVAQALREHDQAVMDSGQTRVTEETVVLRQRRRVFLATRSPLRGAAGEVLGIVGVSRELTDRTEAERDSDALNRDLKQRLDELDTMMRVLPIGIGISRDPECRHILHNPALARMLNVPVERNPSLSAPLDERTTAFRILQHGRELTPSELPMQRAAAEGRPVMGWEGDLQTGAAPPVTLLGHAVPLFDEAGRARGAIGAFIDITERKRAEEEQELLAHAGKVIASTLDYERTLQGVAELAVPRFADWCFVDLVTDDSGRMRRVAHAFPAPSDAELARVLARYPTGGDGGPSARALLTGAAVLMSEFTDELRESLATSEEHLRAVRELGAVSVIIAPLVARGRGLGVVTFAYARSGRRYGPADVSLAEELARRAAVAVDNAELYRAAQEAARRKDESLALVDTLIASAPVGFALLTPELRYARVNDAFAAMLGLTPEQIVGRAPRDIAPALGDELERRYRAILANGKPIVAQEISGELPSAPGKKRSWISNSYPVRTSDGRLVGIGLLTTEITERKRAEERERFLAEATALLSSSLRYEATLQRLVELTVPVLGDWCTVDMVEGGVLRRLGAAHREPQKAALLHELARRYPVRTEKPNSLSWVLATGEPVFLPSVSDELLASACEDAEHLRLAREIGLGGDMVVPLVVRGQGVGVLMVGRVQPGRLSESDLALLQELARRAATAVENARLHREAERARAAAESAARRNAFLVRASELLASSLEIEQTLDGLLRLAVPMLGDGGLVLLREEDGTLRQVAEAAREEGVADLLRLLRELPVRIQRSHPLNDVFAGSEARHVPDYTALIEEHVTDAPEYVSLIQRLGMREGVVAPLHAHGRNLGVLALAMRGAERGYSPEDVVLVSDLARQVAQAMANNRLYRDAQLAVRLRDEFLSIASHELRTPLAALQLQLLGMQRAAEKGQETLASSWVSARASKANANVQRLAELIDKLLDVSRLTSGHLELQLEPVDLSALAREVAERFSDQLNGAPLTVRAEAPVVGQWDRFRLEQVVTNLVANAIKYGRGQPIEVEVFAGEEGARLRVRDRGIGISPEGQARIFGRFERAVPARQYSGFGLGLWIAKQIVEALGGRIAVQSEPEQGSTFTVELPRSEAPGARAR